jgi:hypothetical protein
MGLPYVDLNRSATKNQLRFRMLVGLCGAMMLVSGGLKGEARAAEWSAEPSLSVKGEYNSNLLLFNGNNEVWGDWTSPALKFKGSTESLMVEGNVRSEFVHYYGSQNRSLTNLYFPLRTSYRWDRHTFNIEGGFTRDNTLRSELQQTGLVLAFTQRSVWTARPTWTVGLTERLNWQLGYQFTDATYENGLSFGLVNYQVQGGSSSMSYQATERDQVQFTGEYVRFETPAIQQHWTYYGIGASASHSFTESLTGTLSSGVRFIASTQDIAGGSLTDHQNVWVYSGRLKQVFDRATITVEGSREVNPSGFGSLLQTDRVGGSLSHNLTDTVTLSVEGATYFVTPLSSSTSRTFPQTRFTSVSPKISWTFAEWWSLGVGYSYAERAVGALDQWNFANSTFVTLTYGGPKWSVSR